MPPYMCHLHGAVSGGHTTVDRQSQSSQHRTSTASHPPPEPVLDHQQRQHPPLKECRSRCIMERTCFIMKMHLSDLQ